MLGRNQADKRKVKMSKKTKSKHLTCKGVHYYRKDSPLMFNRTHASAFVVLAAVIGLNIAFGLTPALAQCEFDKLTASDGAMFDWFGWSVAISGDTAVIGAFYDDSGTGSAYVFRFNGSSWIEQDKLLASDGAAGDYFGWAVAIAGDTVVIGASADDNNRGSAYIFTPNDIDPNNWVQQDKLTASDGAASEYFGVSVAISGDTIVVGAKWDDDKGTDSGSAYIFTPNDIDQNRWDQQAKLLASDGQAGDWFGISVAISDDTAVIGAYGDDDKGSDSGSAYIFTPNDIDPNNWDQQAKLLASDGAAADKFGYSVAISGDNAIVGAWNNDSKGSAYVFHFDGCSWTEQPKLLALDTQTSDWFGFSVAISGDTAVIGAYGDDDKGSESGSAYIFTPNDIDTNNWDQQDKLLASDGAASDWFGHAVAISGHAAVIGANYDDSNNGSAYVFAAQLGDLDIDGDVDLADFAVLADQWLKAPALPCADIAPCGGDGIVDSWDLDVFCDHWLEGAGP